MEGISVRCDRMNKIIVTNILQRFHIHDILRFVPIWSDYVPPRFVC